MASTMSSSAQRQPISRDQSLHNQNPDNRDPGSQRPRSQAPQSAAPHVPWRTKLAIVSVGLLSFVGILTETSMNVTFPTLMRQMHVSLATVQWLTTGYLLLVTIVMSTTAYVLKRFSPRSLFVFALVMSTLGTVMCLVAPNFPLLLAGRMLQAFATGIATPLMFQLIFTRVPLRRIGVYTGFASVIVSLAPALGPTYGGVLTSVWSWRAIFSGVLPLLVLIAIAGLISVRDEGAGAGAAVVLRVRVPVPQPGAGRAVSRSMPRAWHCSPLPSSPSSSPSTPLALAVGQPPVSGSASWYARRLALRSPGMRSTASAGCSTTRSCASAPCA